MTRARLRFLQGQPLEFDLDDVVGYGPGIKGFRAWLGAVFASAEGRWVIRFTDERVLGFRREDVQKVRVTPQGISLVLGDDQAVVDIEERDVRSYGPEPEGVRAWLGGWRTVAVRRGSACGTAERRSSRSAVAPI